MKRLYCDNLREFIAGRKIFYRIVDGQKFEKGETIILYNENGERAFSVTYILYDRGQPILGVTKCIKSTL